MNERRCKWCGRIFLVPRRVGRLPDYCSGLHKYRARADREAAR